MVAARMAGWYGGPESNFFLFRFAAIFGGIAQFLAGMWAYRARDGLHGTWGSFWMAYGLLNVFFVTGWLAEPSPRFTELGYWFIVLAATIENAALTTVLGFLAAGSTLAAIGYIAGSTTIVAAAGWCFIVSAIVAWYTASAMMIEATFGRSVLPLGRAEEPRGTAAAAPPVDRQIPTRRVG